MNALDEAKPTATPSTQVVTFAGVSQSEIDDIRQLQTEIEIAAKMTIDKVIDAGGKLSAIRAKLKHGQWLPFVRHIGISDQTARNYIRVWEQRHTLKSQNILNLTDAYAATLPPKNAKSEPHQMSLEEAEEKCQGIRDYIDNRLADTGRDLKLLRDSKGYKHFGYHTFAEYCRQSGYGSEWAQAAIDYHEVLEAAIDSNDPDILVRAWNDDIMMRFMNACIGMAEKEAA
jgi:hypothetical protein